MAGRKKVYDRRNQVAIKIYLDKEVHRKLKIDVAEKSTSLQQIAEGLIINYLKSEGVIEDEGSI